VAQDVKRARLDPGGLAMLAEPRGESLWVDRATELVGKDQVLVGVGVAGEVPLEQRR
jgi:hypothetical protein